MKHVWIVYIDWPYEGKELKKVFTYKGDAELYAENLRKEHYNAVIESCEVVEG